MEQAIEEQKEENLKEKYQSFIGGIEEIKACDYDLKTLGTIHQILLRN